ncbi:endoplasmic reticulum-based factor for assembly of V-ATPase-domain-containing protein [Umbelopsis sp. AD052]|nr:endoplasmic reticulum-based factor for assembly of V-ATPase-domain-containing protein [Umbelopsis sp. AD052]
MTEITVTPIIRDAINQAIEVPECDETLLKSIQSLSEAESIPLDVLVNVSKLLVAEHSNSLAMDKDRQDTTNISPVEPTQYYLHELMKGSSIYKAPLKRPSRNPELQARLDRIAADNQNKEYAQMVKSVVGSEKEKLTFKIPHDEMQEIRGHVTAIINVLFSIVACFGAFYKMSSVVTSDMGIRVLLSLFGAIIVGIAEVTLYMSYLRIALSTPDKPKKKKMKAKTR